MRHMKPHQDWNGVRYDAGRDHVESYFLKATSPDALRALWLKATIFAREGEPQRAVAEAWAIAFDRRAGHGHDIAVKHSLPFDRASFSRDQLQVSWEKSGGSEHMSIERDRTQGEIASGKDRIRWDLKLRGERRPFVMLPYMKMYTGQLPSSKTVTPAPDLCFSGELEVNGERWEIDDWRGMQGHNWGRGHAERYAWCHCNQFEEDEELVVEVVSAQVRVGPILTPVLTLAYVRHRGVDYAFNLPKSLLSARGDIGLRRFHFTAKSKEASVSGLIEAHADDFVGLYYANPSGAMTYCLNSKLASARLRFEAPGQPPLEARSKAAALEIGTRRADHGVKMYV